MKSPQAKCPTRTGSVSSADPLTEQIEILTLTRNAFRTLVTDRIEEFQITSDALLHAAREYQSMGNLRAAQAALDRIRIELDRVIGPSRVKSLPTM